MKRPVEIVAAAVAAAALLGLGACGSKAGAAAVVGGTRISEASISSLVQEAQAGERKLKRPVTPVEQASTAALNWQVRMIIVDAAAKKMSITATKTEVDEIVNKAYQEYGKDEVIAQLASNGFPESQIPAYARLTLLQSKVSQAVMKGEQDQAAQERLATFWQTLAGDMKVEIAPRFGTWNNDIIAIDPPKSKVASPASSPSTGQ